MDDVDMSIDGNEDAPWAAKVAAGSSVGADKGLVVDLLQGWIISATAVASCCTIDVDKDDNKGSETATVSDVAVGAVPSIEDVEVGVLGSAPALGASSLITAVYSTEQMTELQFSMNLFTSELDPQGSFEVSM